MDTFIPIEPALAALGALLEAEGCEVRVVVVGGAALGLLGVVERPTRDVDVLAIAVERDGVVRLAPPEPLPQALERGILTVARDLALPINWMNAVVASQWKTGLPPGLDAGMQWRRYGGLSVGLPDRLPLVCLKLYAAADQAGPESRHFQDLVALMPAETELARAAVWIETQDPTIGYIVAKVIAHARTQLR